MDYRINGLMEGKKSALTTIHLSINPTIRFMLALALFVAGVGTDHPDDAFAADDFAIFAKLFD